MGRYAQRRIRGGGDRALQRCVQIIEVNELDDETLNVIFSGAVTAGDFDASEWQTTPNAIVPIAVEQAGPLALTVEFDTSIEGEDLIILNTTAPGVCTPQVLTINH